MSGDFLKQSFIFASEERKPYDYRYISSFPQASGVLQIDGRMVRLMERELIRTVISLPPSEQAVKLDAVSIFTGNKRFLNTMFYSRLSSFADSAKLFVFKSIFRQN